MTRLEWKGIVAKTKRASKKRRLGKRELFEVQKGVMAYQDFMRLQKSIFAEVNRKEVRHFKPRLGGGG